MHRSLLLLTAPVLLLCGQQIYIPSNKGGVATEDTLTSIYNMKEIAAPESTGEFTTYHVSSQPGGDFPVGADTNPGTEQEPIKTLSRVQEIITENGCGLEFVFDKQDTWTGPTNYGDGLASITTCTDTDRLAIYLRSSGTDTRATFDCTGSPTSTDTIKALGVPNGGWVVVEGIHVQNCPCDVFDTTNAGKMIVVNSGTENISGGNNSFTAHASSTLVGLNVYANHDASSGTPSVIASTGTSNTLIISDKKFEVSNPLSGIVDGANLFIGIGLSSPGEMTIVGAQLGCEPGDTCVTYKTRGVVSQKLSATGTNSITAIRTHIYDIDTCFYLRANAVDRVAEMNLFHTTCTNSKEDIKLVTSDTGAAKFQTAQCALFGCHPSQGCWEACNLTYTKTLNFTVPAFVTGTEFDTITVGGDGSPTSAR